MKRIAIIGCSGSGKSTLAAALGARLGLPVVHLDVLFWRPDWKPTHATEYRPRMDDALGGDAWISDGNFLRAADFTLGRADTIVWLDLPRLTCLRRALWRALSGGPRGRRDLPEGCREQVNRELVRDIWLWDRRRRRDMENAIDAHGANARLVRLRSDRETARFLADLA